MILKLIYNLLMSKLISLELFFIDGKPDGMLTVEVFGWTGRILVLPRTRLIDALKREESSYAGVYILLGDKDEEMLAYIGEGESIKERIRQHDSKKDWWTKAVLITSAANNLNKAHVRYIEARLIQEGRKANNTKLDNGTNPPLPSLNEASIANMEEFIERILMVLPTVQVDLFVSKIKTDRPQQMTSSDENPIFELTLKKEGVKATAILNYHEFVVQQGSLARGNYIGDRSDKSHYWKLYDKLIEQGVLVKHEDSDNLVFTKSYAFSSTSAAGAVCNGRSTAGPLAWKVQGTKQTYRDWEIERLARD